MNTRRNYTTVNNILRTVFFLLRCTIFEWAPHFMFIERVKCYSALI